MLFIWKCFLVVWILITDFWQLLASLRTFPRYSAIFQWFHEFFSFCLAVGLLWHFQREIFVSFCIFIISSPSKETLVRPLVKTMFSFFGSLLEFLDIVWTSGCSLCGLHMWPGQLTHCCYLPKGGRAQMIQQKPDLQVYFWNWFNNLTYKCRVIPDLHQICPPPWKKGRTLFEAFWLI